jgi:hypothetical protein
MRFGGGSKRGGMMMSSSSSSSPAVMMVLVAAVCFVGGVSASLGDRLPEFRECVEVSVTELLSEGREGGL